MVFVGLNFCWSERLFANLFYIWHFNTSMCFWITTPALLSPLTVCVSVHLCVVTREKGCECVCVTMDNVMLCF